MTHHNRERLVGAGLLSRRTFVRAWGLSGASLFIPAGLSAATRILIGARSGAATMTLAITATSHEGDFTNTTVTGVAPLQVFFDATASTSTQVIDTYNDALIEWDFGDPGSGNYTQGTFANDSRASRNLGIGPATGHVYASPGLYTATAVGYDSATGQPATKTVTINVRDGSPAEWAGWRTILVSPSGNFTCAGLTGDPQTTNTADFFTLVTLVNSTSEQAAHALDTASSINAFAQGPVRVLIRQGETVTHNSAVDRTHYVQSRGGPCYWGVYNDTGVTQTGTKATIAGGTALASSPIITVGSDSPIQMRTMKGIVFCNLIIDGTGNTTVGGGYGIRAFYNCDSCLAYNCDFPKVSQVAMSCFPGNTISAGQKTWDGWAMVNCTHTGQDQAGCSNGLYYACNTRTYIAGNITDGRGEQEFGSHNLRVEWANKIVIEHNTLSHPFYSRHSLKVHAEEVLQRVDNTAYVTTTNFGNGDYVRPFQPVQNHLIAAGVTPPYYRCTTGSPTATVTFTTGTPGLVNWTGHGFAADQPVRFLGGTLPTGITANVPVYVRNPTTNSFEISTSVGGASIALSGSPSGTTTGTGLSWHSPPTWNLTVGSTVTDGPLVWTCIAPAALNPDRTTWRSDGNGFDTTNVIVRANRSIAPNSGWVWSLGNQDNDDYGKVRNVLMFSNWGDVGGATSQGIGVQSCFEISCSDSKFFDNIIDMGTNTSTSTPPRAIMIWSRENLPGGGNPSSTWPPNNVKAYNNTVRVASSTAPQFDMVWVDDYATNIDLKNNLFIYEGSTAGKTINAVNDALATAAGHPVTKAKNTGDVGTVTTSPGFVGPLTSPDGWVATAAVYKGAGAAAAVLMDLYGVRRGATLDMGATIIA